MRIAILGTGRMAAGLGKGWLKAGHSVAFGSRRPESKRDFHAEMGSESQVYGFEEAIAAGDIVVLAVPYAEVVPIAKRYAALLRGKPVVDISNPFASQPKDGRAGAELTAEAIGSGARVVAAFKDNFSDTLTSPIDHTGQPRDVHYAGDDEEAKKLLAGLARDLGYRPVDCGPLHAAVALDHIVPLMVEMDRRLNGGRRNSSFRFASPGA
jgi:NADPH-dependent F420 reductase